MLTLHAAMHKRRSAPDGSGYPAKGRFERGAE